MSGAKDQTMAPTSLRSVHAEHDARFAELAGAEVPRNYGDPAAEYEAVRTATGIIDRADRVLLRMHGRDPVRMIDGLVSHDLAGAPEGQGRYATLLTAKGKMVADLRVCRRPGGDVWLDVHREAVDGVLAHIKKFVPPLFGKMESLADTVRVLGAYGPGARDTVRAVLDATVPAESPEDAFVTASFDDAEVVAVRTLYTGEDGYDLYVPAERAEALWRALAGAARPVGHAALEALRIEAGRPRWGTDLTESTIPLEAGLKERAISETTGCYTGQEVIVRVLHRGRVNWHLRGLLLGDAPAPAADTKLVREGEEKRVGRVTSACTSPRYGQTIGLAYVRREIDPPATLRLGEPDGPEVRVVDRPFPDPDALE